MFLRIYCTPGKSGVSCQERLPEPCQGGCQAVLGVAGQCLHLARQIPSRAAWASAVGHDGRPPPFQLWSLRRRPVAAPLALRQQAIRVGSPARARSARRPNAPRSGAPSRAPAVAVAPWRPCGHTRRPWRRRTGSWQSARGCEHGHQLRPVVGLSDASGQAMRAIGGRAGCRAIALSARSTRASG
jgi:hypothetical protein